MRRYLEDLSNVYHPETKSWMKTLQGIALIIQCFGGEVPMFFLSSKFLLENYLTTLLIDFLLIYIYRLHIETCESHDHILRSVFHIHGYFRYVFHHQESSLGTTSRITQRHNVCAVLFCSHFVCGSYNSYRCRRNAPRSSRDGLHGNRFDILCSQQIIITYNL